MKNSSQILLKVFAFLFQEPSQQFKMVSFAPTLAAILENLNMENSPTITIQCKNGKILVQKSLLTATSDVFSNMFDHDMLEYQTNIVVADDVDFYAMKAIIGYYNEGEVPEMSVINEAAFSYVIEKYNFLRIKEAMAEAMAEHLLDKFIAENDLQALELIFTDYNCKAQKNRAIIEIATILVKGKKVPDFIVDFDIHDFLYLSNFVCASLIKMKFERWNAFLSCFYEWVSKNSEERSATAVEILGMIDVRKFSTSEVLEMLESLSLNKKFQGFKLMFEITVQGYVKRIANRELNCQNGQMTCSNCGFESTPPYHYSTRCNGVHRCERGNRFYECERFDDKIHSGSCGRQFQYKNIGIDDIYIYTSLNYD